MDDVDVRPDRPGHVGSVLSLPCHSRAEADARGAVVRAFAARPILGIRARHHRLILESVGVGVPAEATSTAGTTTDVAQVSGDVLLDDERITVTLPVALARHWLDDLATRAPHAAARTCAVREDSAAASDTAPDTLDGAATLAWPLARMLIDCLGRLFTRWAGRAPGCVPWASHRLAWLGVEVEPTRDGDAAHAVAPRPRVVIGVEACAPPPPASWHARERADGSPWPAAVPDPEIPLGSIVLSAAPGSIGAHRLACRLAAVCTATAALPASSDAPPRFRAHARRLRFPCPVSVASLVLALTALRRLRRGDVLLPDESAAGDPAAGDPAAGAWPPATLLLPTGQRLPLDVPPDTMRASRAAPPDRPASMARDTRTAAMRAVSASAPSAPSAPAMRGDAEPECVIDIVATHVWLGVDDIVRACGALRGRQRTGWAPPGDPSASRPAAKTTAVHLFVNGREIGIGEWLSIGGRRGVRVLAWHSQPVFPSTSPGIPP